MTDHIAGTALTISVPLYLWQAAPGGALDKLADQWPIIAALLLGLYLLFRAYEKLADRLADRLIEALNRNTAAFTEQAQAIRDLRDRIRALEEKD